MLIPISLTEQDVREGIRLCYRKVNSLLVDAEAILPNDHGSISSGLYTYAVEELGKLLLFQEMLRFTPTGTIMPNPAIFGLGNGVHSRIKFKKFFREPTIPDECKKIRIVTGGIPTSNHLWANGRLISTGSGVMPLHRVEFLNFEFRKEIFYTGWENGAWNRQKDVETSDLLQAITKLRTWISSNIVIP